MTDHWKAILSSDPRYRSESSRGFDFRPYHQPSLLRRLFGWLGV